MKRKEKQEKNKNQSTRELLGIRYLTGHSLQTGHGELVYYLIKPSNVGVLSQASLSARVYALMTVLKGIAEIEMLALNSRENFEGNKRFIKSRLEQEDNPAVRRLLETDLRYLDRIQVQTATAREFMLIVRLKKEKEPDVFPYLGRIEKMLLEQGFSARRANRDDIKRLLAVYLEMNVTTEQFEESDGERWVIRGD